MTKILIPASLTSFRKINDRSFNVTFNTMYEPTHEQKVVIDALHQTNGFLFFKDSEVDKAEQEQLEGLETDLKDPGKTPSKRLRNTLYVYWSQDNKGYKEFKDFYEYHMEKLITQIKNRLE